MSTINFGAINGRRCVTFEVTEDGSVSRSGHRLDPARWWIPAREHFRRWKIARKAWKTRKSKRQLSLQLEP